jgi:solute:Na+ symporter, SSS family
VLGVGTWILFMASPLGEIFPQQLAGLFMAIVGMVVGSIFLGEPARFDPE